uniref:Uncharacterized protein n=1 Tax=Pyxicephalus adspersus TaxID=30357 RepID=A0AAV3B7N9_PYXAD|nr:TPA: hypothetical protein GDO54_001592 [Pyxicephalus adspersus]
MKKNSSMQGTLNKLFGKKNNNNNSLYAENPPWMKPQGAKKTSVDYHDEVHNPFTFADDSGTATLKARPGPRVRPVLQFSNSNMETQGLAVPTPSVPSEYSDHPSIGNGPKLNGNYRMYSSVGDLHLTNCYDYLDEDIPAPPSVPPPPPPTVIPVTPPQESPPLSTVSSPVSPSPPDFIPPTPNSSGTIKPNFEPSMDTTTVPTLSEQQQTDNVPKQKFEGSKDKLMSLPNRFSLNTAVFQHGQTNNDVDPRSSLPRTFKVPPPAPIRTSSIQLQEHQNISYSTDPPPSPVPSSFNPSVQAKLFSAPNKGQQSLNDTLSKRKSMLIMEDLEDLSQNDYTIQKNVNMTDSTASGSLSLKSSMNTKTPIELDTERKSGDSVMSNYRLESETRSNDDLQRQYNKTNTNGSESPLISGKRMDGSKRPVSSIEFNNISFNKSGYIPNGHKTTRDAVQVISVKPILSETSVTNTNVQPEQNSRTRKLLIDRKDLAEKESDNKIGQEKSAEIIHPEEPPSPPPMPPPPPPTMTPPKPPAVPPPPPLPPATVLQQKTSTTPNFVAQPPAPTVVPSIPPVRQASPLLLPKKTVSASSTSKINISTPAPPKAPPAPPPLPSHTGTSTSEPQMPLLKALQEKQQTLKQVPKKSIEVKPAQISSIDMSGDDEQKARVGKIKGELEALFSPKKDEKMKDFKNSRPNLEANKKSPNGNTNQKRGGENTIVNSLMMKVPHIPAVSNKDDFDGDNSEWIPKSNNTNFQIPEPDYLPTTRTQTVDKPTYSVVQSDIAKPKFEIPSKPAFPPKVTDVSIKKNDIPAYKPHHERKASAGSLTLDKLPLAVLETPIESLKMDEGTSYPATSQKSEAPIRQEESISTHPVTGEQVEANSPMALLLAAKKRAQKGSRSMPLEHSNLPKISVSNGTVTSSLTSQHNDGNANTYVVVPKKQNEAHHLGNVSSSSKWVEEEFPSHNVNNLGWKPQKSEDEKASFMYTGEYVPTENRNKVMPSVTEDHNSTSMSNFIDKYTFNISSVPSPVPAAKTYEDIDFGIIPPPAEFMNTPPSTEFDMQQKDRMYVNQTKSDLALGYEWNNESYRPLASQTITNNSDFYKHTSDNYSTGISRDPQKGSLIKKRLYMPDPESSGSYGKNTHSLRSSALPSSYSHMHTHSSSVMVPESRRPSRYMSQGRRVSSENVNKMIPTITDMKYKPQNVEYGKPISRPQSTYQQGMTFTVRPGTRQPISQMYQGGYL